MTFIILKGKYGKSTPTSYAVCWNKDFVIEYLQGFGWEWDEYEELYLNDDEEYWYKIIPVTEIDPELEEQTWKP